MLASNKYYLTELLCSYLLLNHHFLSRFLFVKLRKYIIVIHLLSIIFKTFFVSNRIWKSILKLTFNKLDLLILPNDY